MKSKEYPFKYSYGVIYFRDPEKTIYHRERGLPAREWSNGNKVYLENDKHHRLDDAAYNYGFHKHHLLNGKVLFVNLF